MFPFLFFCVLSLLCATLFRQVQIKFYIVAYCHYYFFLIVEFALLHIVCVVWVVQLNNPYDVMNICYTSDD